MPEISGISPKGPGDPEASKTSQQNLQPVDPKAQNFKAHLEAKVAARRAKRAVPQIHVQEMLRFFNKMGEAFEGVKLVTKYPPIEKDDALYEVRTDKGTHKVIRARDGSYTLFG
jgi:hypothetical protein